ncbi:MAG: UDP-3-O-(3-hydroxymyristoyl)glucosamine N-acyltransferase [Paramuribaculum sp.]|nr:UDP-3-O-(3-hydroxymyristoyl)glucosamine N-acyltransferase [Paramuribaculum sp.]MDE7451916.1 UDP-3-O-(3-hydroxymyristoyl)glucosamine N-acyltransferase [Paramuribaculum sp.]
MEFTASQIAAIANGVVDGNGDVKISTFAKIEEGKPGAISFLSNPKYTEFIYTTGSSAVLVSKDFTPEKPVAATLIRVDDPYATVANLLTMVEQMMNPPKRGVENPSFIHSDAKVADEVYIGAFAYIGKGAVVESGAQIYPQAYVGDGVHVGENSIIYAGAKVYHGCKIGKNCIIHSGAVIGADGFGFAPVDGCYRKIPQTGIVIIEDNVEIGANTTVDRAMMGATKVGQGVKLDNLIQIAHNCEVGANTVMAAQAGVAGSTKVGTNCMIGGQVGLAGHIHIGNGVEIAAQSGLHRNVPDGERLIGTPALSFSEFAAQTMNIRRIPRINDRLSSIEKEIKKNKTN